MRIRAFGRVFAISLLSLLPFSACDCSDESLSALVPKLEVCVPGDGIDVLECEPDRILDFGVVPVGGRVLRTVTLRNTGNLGVRIVDHSITESAGGAFSLPDGAGELFVPPGSELTVDVSCRPLAEGMLQGLLLVTSDDPELRSAEVQLIADAQREPRPVVEVCGRLASEPPEANRCGAEAVVDFGIVPVETIAEGVVTIRSVGALPLSLIDVRLDPSSSGDFRVGSTAPRTLQPGEEIEVEALYRPGEGGPDQGSVQVVTDDAQRPEAAVPLLGMGDAPRICPSPPLTVDFGSVVVGTMGDRSLSFSNCGTKPLDVTAIRLDMATTPEMTIVSLPALPQTLQPMEGINLDLRYAPTDLGPDVGTLVVSSTDPATPEGSFALRGLGVSEPDCDLRASPPALSFGAVAGGASATRDFVLANAGTATCNIESIAITAGGPEFAIAAVPALPAPAAPGAVLTVSVAYAPMDSTQDNGMATVVLDTGRMVEVPLDGNAPVPEVCDLQAEPPALQFGEVPTGDQKQLTVTLRNVGEELCRISSRGLAAGSSPDFTVQPLGFTGRLVVPGQGTNVPVTYIPSGQGADSGILEVASNDPLEPVLLVPLNGGGADAELCVVPAEIDFGNVPQGNTEPRQVSVSSCGTGDLVIRGIARAPGTSAEFAYTGDAPDLPITLPAGQSQIFTFSYSPNDAGGDVGRFDFISNAASDSRKPLPVRGNIQLGPCRQHLVCSPTGINFGTVEVGTQAQRTFACRNAAPEAITITGAEVSAGPWRLTSDRLPTTVPPGGEFQGEVTFTPSGETTHVGELTVVAAAACEGSPQRISLNGIGVPGIWLDCLPPGSFSPVEQWTWNSPSILPGWTSVWSSPVVANVTDDNRDGLIDINDVPDVIFAATDRILRSLNPADAGDPSPGYIRVISGDDGRDHFTIAKDIYRVNSETQLAVGDIDGDGFIEIVGVKYENLPGTGPLGVEGKFATGALIAFNHDGSFLWESERWNRDDKDIEDAGAVVIADVNANGRPNIVYGATVWKADGTILWEGNKGLGSTGHGSQTVVADVNEDGIPEVIAGSTAYRGTDGAELWTTGPDGHPAVGDIDGDGDAEIIVVNGNDGPGGYTVLDHNGNLVRSVAPSGFMEGFLLTAPTLADYDGDGDAEIAIASSTFMIVWDGDGNELWRQPIFDGTGAACSSSFDFEGDGRYEVMHNDEGDVQVWRGDGTRIFVADRSSVTGWEHPVVADIDNDGHAEILTVLNSGSRGVRAYANTGDTWVAAPRIWNQHSYHFTNIFENGGVPRGVPMHWKEHNVFRGTVPRCR